MSNRARQFYSPCGSSSSTSAVIKPQTPLFLRPPNYPTSSSELQKWRKWAKDLSFSMVYHSMDACLLSRELNWLLEDSISPESNQADSILMMRASLHDLYRLWKQRIEDRRPFQYIVGCEHWRDLVLSVEEGVLIPRPETELIVDLVEDAVCRNRELGEGLWADMGTGSGAVGIAIARIPGFHGRVVATDLSPVALSVSDYNVQRYNLKDSIEVRHGSWFSPLKNMKGKLSGLVSNPPYIPSNHIPALQAEVSKHEPKLALDGGATGMDHLLHLCHGAASMLKTGGFLALETNGGKQCKFLVNYIKHDLASSFCNVNMVSDFAGAQRFVTAFCR